MKQSMIHSGRTALTRLCAILLVLVLMSTCGIGQVSAEVGINNQIKGQEGGAVIVGPGNSSQSGFDLILSTGDQHSITMPNIYSYITPVSMYVDAPGDHSIYVYKTMDLDREKLMPFAYEGMRVTAVAEQSNGSTQLSCIVYRDEDYKLRAGWVHSKYLSLWYPGAVASVGSAAAGTAYQAADPVLSWARDYFVNTRQKYTMLSSPVRSVTQFKLNYQVTSRGGVSTEDVLGPRAVYVNDGTGWTLIGQFAYQKIQSVLVTVNLPKAMDLRAVAVIPDCKKPDRFSFRQAVEDVLTTDPNAAAGSGDTLIQSPGAGGSPVGPSSGTLIETTPAIPALRKGSIVTFGNYEQDRYIKGGREPIEWLVLEVQGDRVFLVSRYGLDCLSYCSRSDSVAWETSSIRSWLNGQFLDSAFTPDEQKVILVTEVDNSKSQGYVHYKGDGGANTQDQVFLLSYAEAWKYFYQNSDRACKPTKVAIKRGVFESSVSGNCPWWLRSPGYMTDYVAAVDVDGNRGGNIKYGTMAVRPAMWVSSSALRTSGVIRY